MPPRVGDPVRRERPRRPSEAGHRRDGVVHHRLRRCSGHCRGAGGVPAIDARRAGIGRRRETAAGDMTVMASGSDAAFARLAPVLDAVAGKVYRIGSDIGLGSTVKIIHQLLAGVHIAVAAEAMALAARAGIPLETMYDVVTHAAGNSGCLRIACSTSWMAITRQNPLSIFLSKISGW